MNLELVNGGCEWLIITTVAQTGSLRMDAKGDRFIDETLRERESEINHSDQKPLL